ncbi:MAG TPA: FAD-binding oxidoreductase [Candidatus Nanoarchaeia archaeon]|nr:FAD-binding oxidoreductase [Candidatus Nanoarchaeia archaeon]
MAAIKEFDAVLLETEDVASAMRQFTFSTPEDFSFSAGQFIMATVPKSDGTTVQRAYSITSQPETKGRIDICFKFVPEGIASTHFQRLKAGDTVRMKGPFGLMKLSGNECKEDTVFIGVGAGVAPLRSMIKELLSKGCDKRIVMISGFRTEKDIAYDAEFRALQEKHRNFSYHLTLSAPIDPSAKNHRGRVQAIIPEAVPKDFKGMFYLCGMSAMTEEVTAILDSLGVDKRRIKHERFN